MVCDVLHLVLVYCVFYVCGQDTSLNKVHNSILPSGNAISKQTKLVCPSKSAPVPMFALPCDSNRDCALMGSPDLCCRNRCLKGVPLATKKAVSALSNVFIGEQGLGLVCPDKSIAVPFFSLPCESTKDCAILGLTTLCCSKRCVQGAPPPSQILNIRHEPILFGLVERICPADPIPELSEIKECKSDGDCNPRICCPDKPMFNGKVRYYCRTAAPDLDKIPAPKQILAPLKTAVSYMQCTPPPPPSLDLFPKACESSFDCFPNLCCQENGKRYCRPPKRSLLALVADVTQRLGTSDLARRAIERITT